jgi:hypothetical protein
VKNNHLLSKPDTKYNEWWEQKHWPSIDMKILTKAHFDAKKMGLVGSEKAAYESHIHMNTNGFEFDLISNAKIERPVQFSNGLILSPKFLGDDQMDGSPLTDLDVQKTMQMMNIGEYEYEGWIPITSWDGESIKKAIRTIDETMAGMGLLGISHFDWKPRYHSNEFPTTTPFTDSAQDKLQSLLNTIAKFPNKDQKAIHKSLGWFSNAYRQKDPVAKFLFFMVAIESMIKYIEEDAEEDSNLIKFRTYKQSKSEKRKEQIQCINEKIKNLETNPVKIISESYFECVVGITKRLKNHFLNLYDENCETIKLLFEKDESGKSLYDVRSSIAHGNIDSISQVERELVDSKSWPLERVTRGYMINLLTDKFPKQNS